MPKLDYEPIVLVQKYLQRTDPRAQFVMRTMLAKKVEPSAVYQNLSSGSLARLRASERQRSKAEKSQRTERSNDAVFSFTLA